MTKDKPKTTAKFNAKLEWLPKKTFSLEFSIPWKQVQVAYQLVLTNLTQTADIEGFRKGKAPKEVVEKSTDKGKLYGEVVNQLLPNSYAKAVAQHQLKPAITPKVEILSAEENKPWKFKATACELPEVKLGDYHKIVKGALAKEKIWTPKKGDPKTTPQTQDDQNKKLEAISKALIEEVKLDLPDVLIHQERDRMLSKLLDQVQKLGITIEQYTASSGKTVDQLKKDYQKSAQNSLKMELIVQAIADDKKLKADDKEVDKMIDTAGDEKLKAKLNTPSERAYISSVIRKRKAIDYLLSL